MFHPKKERNLTLIIFYCSSRGQGSRIKPADLPPPERISGSESYALRRFPIHAA